MQWFIVFAALITLGIQKRRLPIQNICAIALLVFGLSFAIEVFSAKTGFPMARNVSRNFPTQTFLEVAWPIPLLWLILLLNIRAATKWLWWKRRASKFYGSEILVVTSVITATLYAMIPLLSGEKIVTENFPGAFVTAVLILLCLTPWLIEKKPQSFSVAA